MSVDSKSDDSPSLDPEIRSDETPSGIDRRTLIMRSAMIGGVPMRYRLTLDVIAVSGVVIFSLIRDSGAREE